METIQLSEANMSEVVAKAVDVFQRGGVVLYPTDTLYAFGVDALSNEAVVKLYELKGRSDEKPIHCVVSDMDMAAIYGEIDGNANALAKAFLPGPLTLILKKNEKFNTGIARGIHTIGIRVPKSGVCTEMARTLGGPITTTSANKSEQVPELSINKIIAQLGHSADLIDLIIDAGELPVSQPSTIVDVSNAEPVIVREGAIPTEEIWGVLSEEPGN